MICYFLVRTEEKRAHEEKKVHKMANEKSFEIKYSIFFLIFLIFH